MRDFWRLVYSVQCWSACLRQEGEGKKRIETEIITGLKSSSTMADGKFKKEVNKRTEIIKVHRTSKPELLDQEYPLTRKLHRNGYLEVQSNKREYFFPQKPR